MKVLRYALVGGTAAVVDFGIFAVFAKFLGYPYLTVGAIGFVVATTVNYFLSIRYVFESGVRFLFHQEFLLVFLVSLIGLGVNQAVLYLGIGILGWEMLFTKLCATGSVFFWNFGARSRFVFSPPARTGRQSGAVPIPREESTSPDGLGAGRSISHRGAGR